MVVFADLVRNGKLGVARAQDYQNCNDIYCETKTRYIIYEHSTSIRSSSGQNYRHEMPLSRQTTLRRNKIRR
jgi:hypothetical protein